MYPFGGFSYNCVNLVNPVHESDKFRSTSRHSNHRQLDSLATRPNVCALSWSRQRVSVVSRLFLLSTHRPGLEVRQHDDQ